MMIALLAMAALASPADTARVVDRYYVEWATLSGEYPSPLDPTQNQIPVGAPKTPTGPYLGNGDVSLIYSGNGSGYVKKHNAAEMDWQQWLYMSKNDLWGSDQVRRGV